MKRLALLVAVLVCAQVGYTQNYTTVSATKIGDIGPTGQPQPLASGSLCFLATDSNDRPISFQPGGGGQTLTNSICQAIVNGALAGTLSVPNPANTVPAGVLYRIWVHEPRGDTLVYRKVAFTGTAFNFDAYQPVQSTTPITGQSVLGPLTVNGNLTITGSCTGCGVGGGGGGGYATIQIAASSLTQRLVLNWTADITCSDDVGNTRTNCALANLGTAGTYTKVTTDTKGRVSAGARASSIDLGDFSTSPPASSGKIPIYDSTAPNAAGGTGAYVPGDPLVQGLFADGSTSAANPVAIGGYDLAGTPALHRAIFLNSNPAGSEYGIVTRNIPSGTQPVSGTFWQATQPVSIASMPSTPVTGTFWQATQPVSGTFWQATQPVSIASMPSTPVTGTFWQATQPVSGTVTANAGTGTFNIQANASVNLNQVAGNSVAADSNGRQILKTYPDTTTPSYYASGIVASAASATDISVLAGNATNTVLVTRVQVTCTQTTAGIVTLKLIRRSTADSAGTSSSTTIGKDDSNFGAASSAAPLLYTANPTAGTADSTIDTISLGCMASGTATPNDIYIYRPLKPLVLRGTAQQLAVNLNGATISGGSFNVTYNWEETTTP